MKKNKCHKCSYIHFKDLTAQNLSNKCETYVYGCIPIFPSQHKIDRNTKRMRFEQKSNGERTIQRYDRRNGMPRTRVIMFKYNTVEAYTSKESKFEKDNGDTQKKWEYVSKKGKDMR